MNIRRWDRFLKRMPQYVWDGWERWMEQNPDHPAHRDQLACSLAAIQMQVQGSEIEPENLMERRLLDPRYSSTTKTVTSSFVATY